MTTKPTNPKDIIGIRKAPMSTVSAAVMAEVGVAMLEGACKYGRHNYRAVGVRSSVYYDATMRHVMDWWEGVDIDPDSGMHHITKAITSLVVLRDAMIQDKCCDDRPPRSANFYDALNVKAGEIMDKYADRDPIHYTESYMQQQQAGWTDETIKAASFAHGGPISSDAVYLVGEQFDDFGAPLPLEPAASIDDESPRAMAIGQNGNDGSGSGWIESDGVRSPHTDESVMPLELLHRDGSSSTVSMYLVLRDDEKQGYWKHAGSPCDIIAYRPQKDAK